MTLPAIKPATCTKITTLNPISKVKTDYCYRRRVTPMLPFLLQSILPIS